MRGGRTGGCQFVSRRCEPPKCGPGPAFYQCLLPTSQGPQLFHPPRPLAQKIALAAFYDKHLLLESAANGRSARSQAGGNQAR